MCVLLKDVDLCSPKGWVDLCSAVVMLARCLELGSAPSTSGIPCVLASLVRVPLALCEGGCLVW